MRQLQLISIFILFLLGCKTKADNSSQDIVKTNKQPVIEQKFFVYDQIDHYHSNFGDDRESFEKLNDSQTKIDSIKFGVLMGHTPVDIIDTLFIDQFRKIDFVKKSIDKVMFSKIDEIFREKKTDVQEGSACLQIYRDVLVFRRQNKVIGIAKICFSCKDSQIKGTMLDTDSFGQNGDYSKLEKLIL